MRARSPPAPPGAARAAASEPPLMAEQRALDRARVPAELGHDRAAVARHGDVVDAGTPGAGDLEGMGAEHLAKARRRDEGDGAVLRDGAPVVGVAGEGEGGIREREDEAAVADPVPVHHALAD